MHWYVLLLQEVGGPKDPSDHVFVQGDAHTGGQHRGVAFVVHRRWAQEIVDWRDGPCPFITISLNDQDSVSYLNVYLPHSGHSIEIWGRALEDLRKDADRKLLQRGVTEIRKWQRRWRFELLLHQLHTARGRNQGNMPKLTGVRLRGNSTTARRTASFDLHWKSICGDTAAAHISTWEDKCYHHELVATHFPGESTISHEDFLNLVQRLPKGKAGADDGVLGEYVQALHAEHLDTLYAATVRRIEGGEGAPETWSSASATLIQKKENALDAGEYRPITILPTLQKLLLRTWMHEAAPFLALRHPRSHGFRAGLQAAEAHIALRNIMEKDESGA